MPYSSTPINIISILVWIKLIIKLKVKKLKLLKNLRIQKFLKILLCYCSLIFIIKLYKLVT